MTDDSSAIGTATMEADGTLILDLRAEGEKGMVGIARLVYPRTSPDYDDVLRHVGPIKPGEQKLVAPWPDEP